MNKNLLSRGHDLQRAVLVVGMSVVMLVTAACASSEADSHKWTRFVQVDGQPEPVPVEWVSTPAGKLAHSIKIPNPLPKDSGYRFGMGSEQYFKLLCEREAGEFIFKTVSGVNGFFFARPPRPPTDDDLMDRYKLEAPEIERTFQLLDGNAIARASIFVNPPWSKYQYIEEPDGRNLAVPYVRSQGYVQRVTPMKTEMVAQLMSRYGLIWRGIKRNHDRESGLAGSEWIVIDLGTHEVLAVQRNYGRTGLTRNTPNGIWWLNAGSCPNVGRPDNLSRRFYKFVSKVLIPGGGNGND